MSKISFAQLFPRANPDALDLLDKMLAFDPSSRISVEEALEHRYLAIWHDASDEPACPQTFDFGFEVVEDVNEMRGMILDEVRRFRQQVRAPVQQHNAQQRYADQAQQYAQQQGGQVPIPEGWTRQAEDPRPQEMGGMRAGTLEQELGYGLDAAHQVR